jgi:allophanate hydrolase
MPSAADRPSFHFAALREAYASGALDPVDVAGIVFSRIDAESAPGIWITLRPAADVREDAARVVQRKKQGAVLPLYGLPFAVKDNIDTAGLPTTAACPDFAYVPQATAPVVARLLEAGAVLVGKTNLDQFATGLVGVRSPYGVPPNPFDSRYISGGSSSGSAAAVARGLVSFALGTDTAGSGRVPAAFNNLVGVKPSRGLFSTTGVVPACRSLDCVSIMTLTAGDAREVAEVATLFDPSDPYSRPETASFSWHAAAPAAAFRFGVPGRDNLEFCGDREAARAFDEACARFERMGGVAQEIDFEPFEQTASMLYDGPWLAERLAGLEKFVSEHPESLLDVIREILAPGARLRAVDAFRGTHRLEALKQKVRPLWQSVRCLVVPTTPTIYRIDEVLADPIGKNKRFARYANFVNLLDLAAVAVPNGFRPDGLPTGVTLIGPWGSDAELLALAAAFHDLVGGPMGATGVPLPRTAAEGSKTVLPDRGAMQLAVVGAHLSGEPLNGQLLELGARLVRACRTASRYRLYALAGTTPPKPGLLRAADGSGAAIEVEVWELDRSAFGAFFAKVAAPLCIGTVELEDGQRVAGFLCEAHATAGATDITTLGGWRAYRRSTSQAQKPTE